ncbi:MAG: hypothetical protein GXP54_03585 [Deltaproteobacteria bacterium]|nr:hypothetical protein [Deltaproteobacteria bacterium]
MALGGGGAFGFAHLGLLRVLEKAGIPIDYVSGVSFGSLVGALYVGGGLEAAESIVHDRDRLMNLVADALHDTDGFANYVDEICNGRTLELTEIPFYPVGYDLTEQKEFVLAEGTLGLGVLSASSMPGAWPTLEKIPGHRIVDGGVVNNVPVSTIWKAGADFILGSSIIPSRSGFRARLPFDRLMKKLPEMMRPVLDSKLPDWIPARIPGAVHGVLDGRVFDCLTNKLTGSDTYEEITSRMNDMVRSLYLLMGQNGRDRSLQADYVFEFEPEDPGLDIYDFMNGRDIADMGQRNAVEVLQEIMDSYRQDTSRRF